MHRKDSKIVETPKAHDEDSAGSRDDTGIGAFLSLSLSLCPSPPHKRTLPRDSSQWIRA